VENKQKMVQWVNVLLRVSYRKKINTELTECLVSVAGLAQW